MSVSRARPREYERQHTQQSYTSKSDSSLSPADHLLDRLFASASSIKSLGCPGERDSKRTALDGTLQDLAPFRRLKPLTGTKGSPAGDAAPGKKLPAMADEPHQPAGGTEPCLRSPSRVWNPALLALHWTTLSLSLVLHGLFN
ncbi:unnamed protein product [Eretmochelys imbricata]